MGKYHKLSRGNAENWYLNTGDGYERGQTPRLGAVICWRKGQALNGKDGAGHVAIVEEIYDDGSILTSNSAYGGTRFYMKKIKPPYSLGGTYTFQGFIYNPEVPVDGGVSKIEYVQQDEYNIGDQVIISGPLYRSSTATSASGSVTDKKTVITRKVKSAAHPYNTTGDMGWMDTKSIKKIVVTKEDDEVTIPVQDEDPTPSTGVKLPLWGIDISEWQSGFKYAQATQEGVKFAILRAGYTGYGNGVSKAKDSSFETHYKNAKAQGWGVGAYWFSRATTYANGAAEAQWMIDNCLKGKTFEYPIAIDVEDSYYQAKAGKTAVANAIKGFCETLEKAGYYAAVYANLNWFKNYIDSSAITAYDKWIAYWGSTRPTNYTHHLWQFGGGSNQLRSVKVAGVTCDQNYAYLDFPTIMKERGLNGFKEEEGTVTPDPTPTPQPEPEPTPTPTPTKFKFNIGDKVVISGPLYRSSTATSASGSISKKVTNITRRVDAKHPYNTTGDLGWMDESSITLYSESASTPVDTTIKKGDKVKVLKAVTYTGKTFKTWYSKYDVLEVSGDRVVIGIGRTVTAAVNKVNLKKV